MVLVGTVTDEICAYEVPAIKVTALRFIETARARIEKAGGECLTFDQLALRAPLGQNTDNSESEDDGDRDAVELHEENNAKYNRLAIACDDGCVRIYNVSDKEQLTYNRTLPRVGGSVTWSPDAKRIYSGSSDGITVGLGGVGSRIDLCIWSLLALRCETIVSGDSSGSVQLCDGQFGTLLQAQSYHKGDVAAAPSHDII